MPFVRQRESGQRERGGEPVKLWRAYYHYADYECCATIVLTVGQSKAEVDETILTYYDSLKPEERTVSQGSLNGGGADLLEALTVEEFDPKEIWEI